MIAAAIVISAAYVAWRDARAGMLGIRTLLAPGLLALVLYGLDEASPQVARALAGAILVIVAIVAVPDLAALSRGAETGPRTLAPVTPMTPRRRMGA
jgi:hypothetical protein